MNDQPCDHPEGFFLFGLELKCPICRVVDARLVPEQKTNAPYYIIPSERLQELLERAHAGEDVALLMTEEYARGIKEEA